MCNINTWIGLKVDAGVVNIITTKSYVFNDDGDGIYLNRIDKIIKSKNKINYQNFNDAIKESEIIISHQRLTTSGYTVDNTHPHEIEDRFIIVHNGVFTGLGDKDKSDTVRFIEMLKENGIMNTRDEQDILKVIKTTLNDLSGSWSIVMYDKYQDVVYYFKNPNTSIHIYTDGRGYFITTNDKNVKMMKQLGYNLKKVNIRNNTLYMFKRGVSGWQMLKVGTLPDGFSYDDYLERYYYRYGYGYGYGYSWYGGKKRSYQKRLNDEVYTYGYR